MQLWSNLFSLNKTLGTKTWPLNPAESSKRLTSKNPERVCLTLFSKGCVLDISFLSLQLVECTQLTPLGQTGETASHVNKREEDNVLFICSFISLLSKCQDHQTRCFYPFLPSISSCNSSLWFGRNGNLWSSGLVGYCESSIFTTQSQPDLQ